MTNTPVPRVRNQGALSVLAALGIGVLVFSFIPLAQWTDSVLSPTPKPVIETQTIPPVEAKTFVPPPKVEEQPKKTVEIKPPSLNDMEMILSPLAISWDGLTTGEGFTPGTILPDVGDIVDQALLDGPPQPSVRVKPNYRGRESGRVDVLAVVDEKGRVSAASVSRGMNPTIDRLAVEAARKWVFKPGTVKGKTTKFRVLIPFLFKSE
jgi:TonB family protein